MSSATHRWPLRFVWPVLAGLILASLWVALTGWGSSDDVPGPLSLTPAAPAIQDDEPDPEGDDLVLPVETYEIFLSRDPFEPLLPAPGGTGGTTDGGTTTDGTTTTTTTDGTTTDGTTTDGTDGTDGGTNGGTTTGGDACSGNDEVVCDGRVVTLVDVFVEDGAEGAQIQVDSTIYTVTEGDTFAGNFRVLSIDPPCVTLLFGDDAFTLCEGERVLK